MILILRVAWTSLRKRDLAPRSCLPTASRNCRQLTARKLGLLLAIVSLASLNLAIRMRQIR
jgi:hypothetical protein